MASTLEMSMNRLEGIKVNKHLYNQSKIAEAEALAAEALRMSNEARLAAARLADVKKSLSAFSKKLEATEKAMQKEIQEKEVVVNEAVLDAENTSENLNANAETKDESKQEEPIVVEAPVEESVVVEAPVEEAIQEEPAVAEVPVEEIVKEENPAEEEPAEEEPAEEEPAKEEPAREGLVNEVAADETAGAKPDPPLKTSNVSKSIEKQSQAGVVSQHLVGSSVVKVIETGNQKASCDEPKPVEQKELPKTEVNAFDILKTDKDVIEEVLDSLGVDKMCGVDDEALGLVAPEMVAPTRASVNVTESKSDPPLNPMNHTPQSSPKDDAVPPQQHHAPAPILKEQDHATTMEDVAPPQEHGDGHLVPVSILKHEQNYTSAEEFESDKDIIEDLFDSLGVDKMCGIDDKTLGFTDRPVPPPPPPPEPEAPFVNPTRVELSGNNVEQLMQSTSWKEQVAIIQRKEQNLPAKTYQRSAVNSDFTDPFGVDHDDLVFCGAIADVCDVPDFEEDEYVVENEFVYAPKEPEAMLKKNVSFKAD